MPDARTLLAPAAFLIAAIVAVAVSFGAAILVERANARVMGAALAAGGLDWVAIETNGLNVMLSGTAPSESARIRALQAASEASEAARVSDSISVVAQQGLIAPVFRIELMRNLDGISVIGLVPEALGDQHLIDRLLALAPGIEVADMLQTAAHAVPPGWVNAVDFALAALEIVPVAQISVTAGRVEVHALVNSAQEGTEMERRLRGMQPRDQVVVLDLVAPRPLLSPYPLRFTLAEGRATLDACAADTETTLERILAAARAAGVQGRPSCRLALGAPSPRWSVAVEQSIAAVAALGAGTLAISDTEILLSVPHDLPQSDLDRIVGRLERQLPEVFNLTALREAAPADEGQPAQLRPELRASVDAEGRVLVAGRLPEARIRDAVEAFARARFGRGAVEVETRLDPDLPSGWSVRALAALEALAELHSGEVVLRSDSLSIRGVSGNPDVGNQVSRILTAALGGAQGLSIQVSYDEALDPVAQAPTPDNCEARIRGILAERQITFAPGSARLNEESRAVLDDIAEVLRDCGELPLEVAGHTDSQGRAETNLSLSQQRAEAVVNALMERRVLVASMVPLGYGAAEPIADNATEEGREANRRIAFTLIRPEAPPEPLDPALEAELEFEGGPPPADATRPRLRPAAVAAAATATEESDD